MKIFIFLIFCLSFAIISVVAQPICGTDIITKTAAQKNPNFEKITRLNDELTIQYIQSQTTNNLLAEQPLYTIPVAVHIVHVGGAIGTAYNPSDSVIYAVIKYLNEVYNGTADGLSGGVGDIQIQFTLAKRDPNCNPTNGINRIDASNLPAYVANGVNLIKSGGISELSLKNLSRWDATKYYNIWIVNKIDGNDGSSGQFVAGYAYKPGAGTQLDGTVMLSTQMKPENKVLPHEIGHALNLDHPFVGSDYNTECPSNSSCDLSGDKVCDTDPISFNKDPNTGIVDFSCRTGTNDCTNTPYSINTENNIMNYTNCFTLFTSGQKSRMLAAMNLSSRSTLANSNGSTATYMGNICPPKINFVSSNLSISETSNSVLDCTGYKDYTFYMSIASSPSANASATITASGTASSGIDYQLTTNGNFSSPSNIINFPAARHDSQSFVIRVYDDDALEGSETIGLNFTINANDGDAQEGNNTASSITINASDAAPTPVIATNAEIGLRSYELGSTTDSEPFNSQLVKKKSIFLYKASELTEMGLKAGEIVTFGLYINKGSTRAYTNMQLKMGATSRSYLVDGSPSLITTSTVKSINDFSTQDGLNLFTLDNPFTWNGTSSVAVEICYNNNTESTTESLDYCLGYSDGGTDKQGNFYWSNSKNCSESFASAPISYFPTGIKPWVYFGIEEKGPTIETDLNASATAALGPNTEIYFKDIAGRILGRIKNLTDFDYGCTEFKIDRAGNSAKDFTGTSPQHRVADKTFTITPTNKNENGQYEITLFYTEAEVSGWKTTTGNQWQDAKILKVNGAVSNYPAGNVPIDSVNATSAEAGSYGTDSTLTAKFNSGFSGFAIGLPDLVSVNIFTFTGNGLWTDASNWINNIIPPDSLKAGQQIIINPMQNGQCVLNKTQVILPNGNITIMPNKAFIIQKNLDIKQQ